MNTERDDREQIEAIRKMMAEKEEKKRAREIRKRLRRKRIHAFFHGKKQISTKKQALAELRKLIKKEGYYQTKIKEALKKRYPDAFVVKISQGAYSQAGIPDVMFIKDGHYFGFEVKRPVVGIRSKLQEQTARMIQAAGGTAAFVCWPEEAIREVEEYEKSQR